VSPTRARGRVLLLVGAAATVLGLAIAGTAPIAGTEGSSRTQAQQTLGGVVVVLGWLTLGWAIHRFGRGDR
jgi:hypothetical protein